MRRLILGLAIVLAMVLMLAAIAAAVPPDFCNDRPDHPNCSGTTTSTTEPPTLQACTAEGGVISISGSGRTSFECLWTPEYTEPAPDGSLNGTVTVTAIEGSFSRLVVFVRDASPGDICVLKQEWDDQPGSDFVASFDLAYGDLPDYPDHANETYWTFDAAHWCYPQDPISGMRADPNGEPLHLLVNFVAKKGTTVDVSLFPAQATP